MSATRLLVLGVVKGAQPVHGYDVRRQLLSWRADQWGNVNPGSIYHALKTLVRDDLVRVVDTGSQGARPERTRYELTDVGDVEFFRLLRESLRHVSDSPLPLRAGLAFFGQLSRDELVATLRDRIAELDSALEEFRHVRPAKLAQVAEHFNLREAVFRAEEQWARQFVERLEAGEYTTAE